MTNELAKKEKCAYLRNGIEVWVDAEKGEELGNDWSNNQKMVVKIAGQFINTADLVGIFDPIYLEELKRTKRGMWKCKFGNWHERDGVCSCHTNRDDYKEMEQTQGSPEVLSALEKTREQLLANKVI